MSCIGRINLEVGREYDIYYFYVAHASVGRRLSQAHCRPGFSLVGDGAVHVYYTS